MADPLKQCPFCGGVAELDTRQGYTYFSAGQYRHGSRIAVYCRDCPVDIGVCREDVPDVEPEYVIGLWNARSKGYAVGFQEAREAAAKVCEGITAYAQHQSRESYKTAAACAKAIRALEKP